MTASDQTVRFGRGVARELGPILKQLSPGHVFLATGQASYELSGAREVAEAALAPFASVRFSEFGSNLKLEEISAGVELFRHHQCDLVIGIGGGSVIDLAKAVAILGPQSGSASDYVADQQPPTVDPVSSIMIPTTAGTGSESTHFSVTYVDGAKQSLSHLSMLPGYALVDPALTDTLSPEVTACSGMDALCQGIESYWSNRSTEISRRLSAQAITIALANLARAVNRPDSTVRDEMLRAANLSGQAINIARTTAAHAASYPLTAGFGITHGQAVALLLPHLFEVNADVTEATLQDRRGVDFVRKTIGDLFQIMGVGSGREARRLFLKLMETVHLETRLSRLGIARDDLDTFARRGVALSRAVNNPRRLDEKDLLSLWQAVF